ncbi:hypothetical protein Arub01_50180 [Actinomadura rubrobrunea]|uniref:Uncharacterized protein n=1 Tax=Actinomadura rubrobrunea TaxID=115335 RepID=A0A9W6Q191_9ACTN|nr:hypothetical protein [Actinomadura rubrobrunea]GLW66774.1 hypothetical protein Arub01_50180 [Actinomadura rubrobrunea]
MSVERGAVLADHADRGALAALAAARGWTRTAAEPAGFAEPEREVWDAGGGTRVVYAESPVRGTRFVCVTGPDAGSAEEAFAAVAAVLPTVPVEEILAGLLAEPAPAPRELIRGLDRLATAARANGERRPEDPRYRRVVERLAAHPERQVRRALLFAVEELSAVRPELADPILARRDEETELAELVRTFAETVRARS